MKKVSKLFWQLILIVLVFFILALYRVSLISNTATLVIHPIATPIKVQEALSVVPDIASSVEASSVIGADQTMTLGMKTWNWISTTDTSGDSNTIKPRAPRDFALTFKKDKTFFITTDCNSFTGVYAINKENISLKSTSSTQLYCENAQEESFVKMVLTATRYSFTSENELLLTLSSGGTLILR